MNLDIWSKQIAAEIDTVPSIGIILGSGLGNITEHMKSRITIPYHRLEGFPQSTVEGHKGQFVFGYIDDRYVVAMQGRFHYYEGYSVHETVLPVKLLGKLGIRFLIVTNAAGGLNEQFSAGDLMLITDHINFTGQNPLRGKNDDAMGPRFPDMTEAYSIKLRNMVKKIALENKIDLFEGCYIWMTGPTYETPAEVKMARLFGADAVGMSTVPEVITARHMGIDVVGISCITNLASGLKDTPLSHDEVVKASNQANEKFSKLINELIKRI